MQKIPTVFLRDWTHEGRLTHQIHPECDWVINGEGRATRMYDGVCVMVDKEGQWWFRHQIKTGEDSPSDFVLSSLDMYTGKRVGWLPVHKWRYEEQLLDAIDATETIQSLTSSHLYLDVMRSFAKARGWKSGTYELLGPAVEGEGSLDGGVKHQLIRHSSAETLEVSTTHIPPYTFNQLRYLVVRAHHVRSFKGVVWRHRDGRMAKLKGSDYI